MRFLHHHKQSIILSFLTACSYLLGYVRDKIFAHYFGLSSNLDIYHASFIIPDTIMNLFLAGAMVSIMVPFMNKYHEDSKKNTYISSILEIGIVLNIIVCIGMYFIIPSITPFVIQKDDLLSPVIFYSRILLLSPLIFLVSNFLGGILVNKRNLIFYGLSPIMYNIGIILGVIVLHNLGTLGIIIGALLGGLCHMGIRLIGVITLKEKLSLHWTNFIQRWGEIRTSLFCFFKLALPKMISLTTLHVNYWLFTFYASQANTEGSIFALNICRNFYNVPISIIAIALATDAFSVLSKQFAEKNTTKFLQTLRHYLLLIAGSGLLFGIVYFFFSPLFLTILLKGGKFTEAHVQFTAQMLSFFGIVIIFESIMQYFARVLHAMQDTFWQMISQISCFIITLSVLSLSFSSLGIIAIPISFSAGMFVQNSIQGFVIWKKIRMSTNLSGISSK